MSQIEIQNRFEEITQQMLRVFTVKNVQYGNSFLEDDLVGSYYDIKRKWLRVKGLFKSGHVRQLNHFMLGKTPKSRERDLENVKQNLIDLANYSILTILNIEKMEKESQDA